MLYLLQWVVLTICDFVQMSIQALLVVLAFNKKIALKNLFIFSVINILFHEIPRFLAPGTSSIVLIAYYILIITASLKLIFKLSIFSGLLSGCFLTLLSVCIQYITIFLLKLSLQEKFDFTIWMQSFSNIVIIRVMGTIILLALTLIIYYAKAKVNIPEDISRKRRLAILINSIVIMIIMLPNLVFFENASVKLPSDLFLFNAVSVFILLIISIYTSIISGELEVRKQENEFQKLYINTLNEVVEGLRGFKHDYNNTIQVIGGYLAFNDLEGLKKYHSELHGSVRTLNNLIPLNSYVKDNPPIYGLLLSKLSFAEIKGINFQINILTEIDIHVISILDFCKILGILLDNALEASSESSKKYVELIIKKGSADSALEIEICNTYAGQVDTVKIFENGFTTKQGHSGFGLFEVRKILSKYSFKLESKADDGIFIQKLEIS